MVISRGFIFIVAVCIVLSVGSGVFAACPNIKGVWNMSFTSVHYDVDTLTFGDESGTDTIDIANQIGCLFYGTYGGGAAFTGVIKGTNVIITGQNDQLSGTLGNPDPVSGKYKKIVFVGSKWPMPPASPWIQSMKGKFTRTF